MVNAGFLWSGLLLASVTVERFISVEYILKVKSWNLYAKTKILMIVYFVVAFGLSSFSVICYNIMIIKDGLKSCVYTMENQFFCNTSNLIVNNMISNGLCSFVILLFTISTSVFLFRLRKNRVELGSESGKEFQISLMLIIVASLFLILRLPEMVLFQLFNYFVTENTYTSLARNVFSIIYLFNQFL